MKSLKDFLQKEIVNESGSPDENRDGVLSPMELHNHLDIQRRGFVDMGDYAAHVMFHAHHPEYLADVAEKFNDIQRRHAAGEDVCPEDPLMQKLKDRSTLVATDKPPIMEGKSSKSRELDPPAVLIMRRKSVRQFPNGQRVALYYVDKINKYVTVPYEDMQFSSTDEETVFEKIKSSLKENKSIVVEHLDGSVSEVTPQMATKIMDLYKKINEANKAKMKDMLEASAKHFQAISKFSKE